MQDLKILNVFDRLYLRKAKFMYMVSRGETPQNVNELFQQRPQNENEPQLRSTSGLIFVPPRPNKEILNKVLHVQDPSFGIAFQLP